MSLKLGADSEEKKD